MGDNYEALGGGGSTSGRDTRVRIQWSAGLLWFPTIPFLIVIIILLCLQLGLIPMMGTSDNPTVTVQCASGLVENDTLCNQTTDCLQGYSDDDGAACLYLARPSNTTCTTPCYSNGDAMCDARGQCIGDTMACTGTCTANSDCTALNFYNDDVRQYFDPVTGWVWAAWYCFFY